ncbi:hypothetical protein HFP47_02705 [Leuconostoc sp. DB-1]|nr:Ltp family lipoprotein [Leuconostoc sp. DB-1]NYS21979.1 hypothetical protein [Leuconostoc sp. DB-1]
MSKKIVGEDGKVYIQKKPFYKRIWFIILTIILICIALSRPGSNNNSNSANSSSKDSKVSGSSSSEDSLSSSEEKSTTTETSSSSEAQSSESNSNSTNIPREYKSALNSADTYANTMHMSKAGLYDQLTADAGEKFSPEAAQYAIDNVKTDWNKNALESAKSYQEMDMSPESIRDQLTSDAGEKFTQE